MIFFINTNRSGAVLRTRVQGRFLRRLAGLLAHMQVRHSFAAVPEHSSMTRHTSQRVRVAIRDLALQRTTTKQRAEQAGALVPQVRQATGKKTALLYLQVHVAV